MSLMPIVLPERAAALILAVGWALVLFLAQGVCIGVAVASLLRGLRRRSAEVRYIVACAGLRAMAICPMWTVALVLEAGPGADGPDPAVTIAAAPSDASGTGRTVNGGVSETPGSMTSPSSGPRQSVGLGETATATAHPATRPARQGWRERVESALPLLVAAWLAGVCVLVLRLLDGLVEVRDLTRRGLLAPPDELQSTITGLVERAGLRRSVGWFLSLRVEVPTVVGWLRPKVLIPAGCLMRLTLDQLEAVLAHEIAHIRRLDYLVNILQIGVESLLFFHPAVWWVSRRIREERENCCDDAAVALCGGDRLRLARALFAMEESRGAPILRVTASGGSLRDRVLRLVAPASSAAGPAESGWAGAGLVALAAGLVVAIWLAGSSFARDDGPGAGKASIQGRVLDEAGKPLAGARVRLYRRDGRWERRHPMIEETTAGPDGSFGLKTRLELLPRSRSRGLPPYVLLSDNPGKAVGWRTIPAQATSFQGDIVLTTPTERTITVVDVDDRPIPGAKVVAYLLGDSSSPSLVFQDVMEQLRPDDGPLTAMTDASGRATLRQLPRTVAYFVATKPGLADNYALREQDTIHLTPSSSLSGTLTGPDGQPLGGVKVVAFPGFMWEFEHAVTDARGRYEFKDLKARGWDMRAFGPNSNPGTGTYKVWIESDRFAVPTQVVVLAPAEPDTLDMQAEKAGVIRVSVTEQGTGKPVANVRIWGFDQITGSSGRFNAYTDEQGRATFYSTPARISLSIAGPPEGVYIKGDQSQAAGSHDLFEFPGGEMDISLTLAPITGPLISVSGICTRPDGTPARGAGVSSSAGRFIAAGRMSYIPMRRADAAGRFTLEEVPAGQPLMLYAETEGRKFAGTAEVRLPERADPEYQVKLRLERTVTVEMTVNDTEGNPLPSRRFHISPRVAEEDFPFLRRTVETDAEGRVRLDGIVRGLSYKVQEDVPPRDGPIAVVGGRPPWHEEVRVLVPMEEK